MDDRLVEYLDANAVNDINTPDPESANQTVIKPVADHHDELVSHSTDYPDGVVLMKGWMRSKLEEMHRMRGEWNEGLLRLFIEPLDFVRRERSTMRSRSEDED